MIFFRVQIFFKFDVHHFDFCIQKYAIKSRFQVFELVLPPKHEIENKNTKISSLSNLKEPNDLYKKKKKEPNDKQSTEQLCNTQLSTKQDQPMYKPVSTQPNTRSNHSQLTLQ